MCLEEERFFLNPEDIGSESKNWLNIGETTAAAKFLMLEE
jgi:hypothetical protein